MILFIKNIFIEGPETLGDFFIEKGFNVHTVDLQEGDSLPQDFKDIEAVIVLGGPMNVYEEKKYPFLKEETVFIRKVVDQQIPFLGLCLGSQLLAKAFDAKVERSPHEEIGFSTIQLTEEGKNDPLFKGLEEEVAVFQWHGDMFHIPQGATLLARSEDCPRQAFRVGPNAYGLQFHVEITEESIRAWTEKYFDKEDSFSLQRKAMMLRVYEDEKEQFNRIANNMYENFLEIMRFGKHPGFKEYLNNGSSLEGLDLERDRSPMRRRKGK